jgi:hypothetical protein
MAKRRVSILDSCFLTPMVSRYGTNHFRAAGLESTRGESSMTRTVLRPTLAVVAAFALVSAVTGTPSSAAQDLSLKEFQAIERSLLIDVGSNDGKYHVTGVHHSTKKPKAPNGLATKKGSTTCGGVAIACNQRMESMHERESPKQKPKLKAP